MSTATPLTDNGPSKASIVLCPSPIVEPTPKRWTREEYHRLDELGLFEGQRVELIDGEIIQLSPHSPQHATTIERVRRLLASIFGDEFWIRAQIPVTEGEFSEPEPDLCVVHGKLEDFAEAHPTSGRLIVEVAKTSLKYDRNHKQHLYALMEVPDYWVLDLVNRQLIVHRKPIADEAAPMGHRYESIETIAYDGEVAPLEVPEAKLSVAAMLPSVKDSEKEK